MRNRVSRSNPHHYEVSYMLPAEFAADPPGPTDMRITLSREDETLYAVRARPGVRHYYAERSNGLGVGFPAPKGIGNNDNNNRYDIPHNYTKVMAVLSRTKQRSNGTIDFRLSTNRSEDH
ncbi:hypothetical protein TNCV_1258811 [Trichonephila clavipes]|nr:hypothetical protein TNCV_1258811 [Trichonephila clavipes]